MPDEPDFSKKSNVELSHYMTQFPSTHAFYKLALSELSKREITISQIPNLPDDMLRKTKNTPDVPDARGLGHGPVNEAIKIAASDELRRREHEKNIKAIAAGSEKKFYEKPIEQFLLAVIAGLIVVYLAYYFGWNGPKEKLQTPEQKQSAIPASNIRKKIPKQLP